MCSQSRESEILSDLVCSSLTSMNTDLQLLSTLDMIWCHVCYRFDIAAAISFLLSSCPVLKTVLQLYEKSLL